MTKKFYNSAYQAGHISKYGDLEALSDRTKALKQRTNSWLENTGLAKQLKAQILEIGCGMACLSTIHPGWHGVEYSKSAVERVKAIQGSEVKIFEGDAQCLQFEDQSFDGVFTWAALEHVIDPDKACCEIDRILRGGGMH